MVTSANAALLDNLVETLDFNGRHGGSVHQAFMARLVLMLPGCLDNQSAMGSYHHSADVGLVHDQLLQRLVSSSNPRPDLGYERLDMTDTHSVCHAPFARILSTSDASVQGGTSLPNSMVFAYVTNNNVCAPLSVGLMM